MSTRALLPIDSAARLPYAPLVPVAIALSLGIASGRAAELPPVAAWLIASAVALLWLVARRANRQGASAFLLLLMVAALGTAWHQVWWQVYPANELGRAAGIESEPVALEAFVGGPLRRVPAPAFSPLVPLSLPDRTRLDLRVVAARDGSRWRSASGRAILQVDGHLLGVGPGDRLRLFAKIARPSPALNPGQFDLAAAERGQRRLFQLRAESPDCVVRLSRAVGPVAFWPRLRAAADRHLWRNVHPAQADLAAALLLGMREELRPDETQAYVRTGTVHILAISGMHLGLLMIPFFAVERAGLLGRRAALALASLVALAYAALTAAEPPVVRAALVVLVLSGGAWLGRSVRPLNALAAALIVVLALNPSELFRTGTQLSFLGVAALVVWGTRRSPPADPLEKLVAAARPWHWRAGAALGRSLAHMLAASLVVWLATFPLVASQFHLFSPIAVPLNLVLWPFASLAMLSGFVLVVAGPIVPGLSAPAARACELGLDGMSRLVDLADRVPNAYSWIAGPPSWWIWGLYALAGVGLVCLRIGRVDRTLRVALVVWLIAGGLMQGRWLKNQFRATFVAVGHGCSVLVELPGGRTLLYDAGELGSPEGAARKIAGCLWHRGVSRLDVVVVSHADLDHFNALPALCERFDIGEVWMTARAAGHEGPAIRYLREVLARRDIPLRTVHAGSGFTPPLDANGPTRCEWLHPPRDGISGSDNANSLVLAIHHAGRSLLLTGDLETPGLEQLLALPARQVDVLLAPHHGSRRSDAPGLATWCRPGHVVISGSHIAEAASIERAYRNAGSQVFHTARDGAVEFRLSANEVAVQPFIRRSPVARRDRNLASDADH